MTVIEGIRQESHFGILFFIFQTIFVHFVSFDLHYWVIYIVPSLMSSLLVSGLAPAISIEHVNQLRIGFIQWRQAGAGNAILVRYDSTAVFCRLQDFADGVSL